MLPLVSSMTTTVIGRTAAVEVGDRLRLLVVEDLEVFLRQVGHEPLLDVGDGHEQRHDLCAGLEGGCRLLRQRLLLLLLRERRDHGPGRDDEAGEKRCARKIIR